MHGENDNDVPIAEAEQFYIGLKDVGTEAVMVRYPREGHGIRESKHVVDSIDRSIRCAEALFAAQVLAAPVRADVHDQLPASAAAVARRWCRRRSPHRIRWARCRRTP